MNKKVNAGDSKKCKNLGLRTIMKLSTRHRDENVRFMFFYVVIMTYLSSLAVGYSLAYAYNLSISNSNTCKYFVWIINKSGTSYNTHLEALFSFSLIF